MTSRLVCGAPAWTLDSRVNNKMPTVITNRLTPEVPRFLRLIARVVAGRREIPAGLLWSAEAVEQQSLMG